MSEPVPLVCVEFLDMKTFHGLLKYINNMISKMIKLSLCMGTILYTRAKPCYIYLMDMNKSQQTEHGERGKCDSNNFNTILHVSIRIYDRADVITF